VADLNGDGKPDLVLANRVGNTMSVLLGNGDGSFQPQQTFQVGSYPFSVAVADVNGDGKRDLVVANYGIFDHSTGQVTGSDVWVLLGQGDGTFAPQQAFPAGPQPTSVVVADVNGDGIPDLVVANAGDSASSGCVSVLLGNGDGSFQNQQTFQVGSYPSSVAVADVNGDGKPDLVTVAGSPGHVSVLLGNGDGSFQTQQTFAVSLPFSTGRGGRQRRRQARHRHRYFTPRRPLLWLQWHGQRAPQQARPAQPAEPAPRLFLGATATRPARRPRRPRQSYPKQGPAAQAQQAEQRSAPHPTQQPGPRDCAVG
jgi:hypothetical protein